MATRRSINEIGQRLDELADELGLPELISMAEDLAYYVDDEEDAESTYFDMSKIVAGSITTSNAVPSGTALMINPSALTWSSPTIRIGP